MMHGPTNVRLQIDIFQVLVISENGEWDTEN